MKRGERFQFKSRFRGAGEPQPFGGVWRTLSPHVPGRYMKTISAVAIVLQLSTALACQQPDSTSNSDSATNALYYEILGQGLGVSLNYERMLSHEMGLHIGYTDWVTRGFPFGFHYFVGSTHTLELGAGLMIDVHRYKGVYPTGIIGYRYQPTSGGFVCGAGLTPIVGHPEAPVIIGGISLGWSF